MKSEREKMVCGKAYRADDAELDCLRKNCRRVLHRLNREVIDLDTPEYYALLAELFDMEMREDIILQPPFYCDYGANIRIGKNFMANFDCVILDCAEVSIGDNVLLGPKVQLYAAFHPTDPVYRAKVEHAGPIQIGNNVWIGGGTIVLPNITIGDNTVIGAGSVVTKDIPPHVVAAGNPCRVIRELNPDEYGKRMFP